MFMLSYIFGGLVNHSKPSLVNHTSLFKISELKVFKNLKAFGEISSNWPKDSLGVYVY